MAQHSRSEFIKQLLANAGTSPKTVQEDDETHKALVLGLSLDDPLKVRGVGGLGSGRSSLFLHPW
jgi:hypothetical protein